MKKIPSVNRKKRKDAFSVKPFRLKNSPKVKKIRIKP